MKSARFAARTAFVGALLVAGVAFAEGEATEPNAKMRETAMMAIGGSMKVLGDMSSGKTAYDAAAAEEAKTALIAAAETIPTAFATQGDPDPTSEAKPEIWSNWDEFLADAEKLKTAAAAADVSSVEAIKASMGVLGGACKDCHTEFRVMK